MPFETLQYISPQYAGEEYFNDIQDALDAGVRWVQVRVKDVSQSQLVRISSRVSAMCLLAGATCIINDSPLAAQQSGAHGVHLGKNDTSPIEARLMLGENAIIGGTANTLDDVLWLVSQGVDYIGLGPFRFTTTKKDLSPFLGIEGYVQVMGEMRERGISTPVVAIGGITLHDIQPIMLTGVQGIAVSGLVSTAFNKTSIVNQVYQELGR